MSATNEHETHETVARAYAEALRRSKRTPGSSCCGSRDPCGSVSRLAGYTSEAAAHPEAAASSFGCGNPLALADVRPGDTVLDLGSGAGLDLLVAAERVGPGGRVIGVDLTEAMVDEARAAARRAGYDRIEVRQGLIEDLPVETASVDWVISNCVINLSPAKEKVFAEIARVLRHGGRFSIADIVVEELPDVLRRSVTAHAACLAGAISEQAYLAGLRRAGLADVEVAERLVYDVAQLRALVEGELGAIGLGTADTEALWASVEGRVSSARFVGRKPA